MKKVPALLFLGFIVLFFCFPKEISQGAEEGLLLWFNMVVPALLPFFILSDFLIKRGTVCELTGFLQPLLSRVLHISGTGCFAMVIGGIAGYPAGANVIGQLYREKQIEKAEAQYLLGFCNNASPVFLMSYVGCECMNIKQPFLIYAIVILSGFLSSGCFLAWFFPKKRPRGCINTIPQFGNMEKKPPIMMTLEASILDSFTTITKIGGYIILFSILSLVLKKSEGIPEVLKGVGMALLEITTGSKYLTEVTQGTVRFFFVMASCAFGGISSLAQTAGVLSDTDLSIKKYAIGKLRQGVIAGILSLFI